MTIRQFIMPSALGLLGLLALAGCSSAKPEASVLATGVDLFHRASNEQRPSRADALRTIECHDAEVCAAKASCVEATAATAAALRLKQEAEAVLAAVEARTTSPDDPAVKALPAKLERASTLLTQGHDAMPACDKKILILRERYGL